jgi:hypothetical protein
MNRGMYYRIVLMAGGECPEEIVQGGALQCRSDCLFRDSTSNGSF